jgi:tripartite-type tricarboxylate transporter receptor subunit TctC
VKDFTHVSLVAVTPYLLVTSAKNPGREAFRLRHAREEPARKMNYGSAGSGTATHLSMEMLKDAAKIDMQHIPYKSNAESDRAILAGEVDAVFGSMPALLQNAKAGKVKPIAVGTATRSPALPDVPTVAEQGYPGFEAALWLGIMGPANMPKPVVDKLYKALAEIVATPEFKTAMDANGAEPLASKSPQEFTEMLRGQVDKYVKITKAIGIKLD